MRMLVFRFLFGLVFLLLGTAAPGVDLRNGDRVALVGDTLIEQEQESGWLETVMACDFPSNRFTVRNLGWSADTPAGKSRASFDFSDPQKGFSLLTNAIAAVNPTVVFVGYGMASSFDSMAGLPQFQAEMSRLIDFLIRSSSNHVRIVILSPLYHEKLSPPMQDPAWHNVDLCVYTEALRELARQRGLEFVDLFDWKPAGRMEALTQDGIHLTPLGYEKMAGEVARQLHWPEPPRHPSHDLKKALRAAVLRKNQLFFDRWRPQNETYLFGFRRGEQGQNGQEIPQLDPLVKAEENRIGLLQDDLIHGVTHAPPPLVIKSPPPPAPADQPLPAFTIAPGFEINLWAEDPMLAKPTQINFDPQGRLWVSSSALYPQIEPGQAPDDKIVVLEDATGAGRATRSTVFVDNLFIPHGVEPGDGGCYVGQSTELLHFTGIVGQPSTLKKEVVLAGFGTEDTHHMVHTLEWGPGGELYFNQSIYIHSHIETPRGVVRLNSGGVFRYRPEAAQLDVYLRGFANPWGHQFDAYGQSFVSDGAGLQGLSWGMADATYAYYAQMRREMPSISPGQYPKFCGLAIVASRQFPDDWQGNFITADFRAHRLVRFSVNDDGAGYVTKEMPDFLTSTNVAFRPVDLKFGPDGALYVADWANPIINHGEVDFRDPRRDHIHGRIWRIVAKGRPLLPRENLAAFKNEALFNKLLSPNSYEVQQARRVLAERGKKILGDLKSWLAAHSDAEAGLQALWVKQSVGVRDDQLLIKETRADDGRICAAAVKLLSDWPQTNSSMGADGLPVPTPVYERAVADDFPRVRLEAVRALRSIPSFASAEMALRVLHKPMDPFLDYALWLTVNQLSPEWLPALRSGEWGIDGHEAEIGYALNAIEAKEAAPALHQVLLTHAVNGKGQEPWIELIGRDGLPADVNKLYLQLWQGEFDIPASRRVFAALDAAFARGVPAPPAQSHLTKFLSNADEGIQRGAVKLAGDWGAPDTCLSALAALAQSTKISRTVRGDVFAALKKIGGAQVIAALQPLALPGANPEIRRAAVVALAGLDPARDGTNAIALLNNLTNQTAALELWRLLLANGAIAPYLTVALPHQGFSPSAARAGLQAARESGQNQEGLILALTQAGGLQGTEAMLSKTEIQHLGQLAMAKGDPARGEGIFRRAQQSCVGCHSIGGAGGKVGPDLTSIGASSPIDYLIESVLYPNKEIKDGYQSCQVETKDGDDYSGIPVREDAQELVLRTAADQEVTVQKSQIKKRKIGGSLMPSGLTEGLTSTEQLDLYRFLAELGRPGKFDASKGNVARFWAVANVPTDTETGAQLRQTELTNGPWRHVTALASGEMPWADLERAVGTPRSTALPKNLWVGTRFRSVITGRVTFTVAPAAGQTIWVDGLNIPSRPRMELDLPAGTHAVIIECASTNASIRLGSDDGTFLVR